MTAPIICRYERGPVKLVRPVATALAAARVPLQRASRESAKMQKRINSAVQQGDLHKARGLQSLYLRSFSGRLRATATVNKVLRSAERCRSRELVAIAERISPFEPTSETAKLVAVDKSTGGFRPLTIFGLERAALQSLACAAMRPFHEPDPRQFAITGGGHNAAADIIRQGLEDGYKWFVSLDITSFYSSILRRCLNDIIPLPNRVIEQVICPPPIDAIRIARVGNAMYGSRLAEASQSGISQGSRASPLIAEIIVKQMLDEFGSDLKIINDADDFGIMAQTKRDAVAISSALILAAARSPAGCLQLRPKAHKGARRAFDGFDFLGYHFRKRRTYVQCDPSNKNLLRFDARVCHLMVGIEKGTPNAILKLRNYVKSWWRSFPLADAHIDDLDYFWARCRVRGIVRRNRPNAVPLVNIAMDWAGRSYAPLPSPEALRDLCRSIRRANPRHRSIVRHWR